MNSNSRIATPEYNNTTKIVAPLEDLVTKLKGISFSFQALDKTEYFNLDVTCANWASNLFETLKVVSTIPKSDLVQNKYRTYRVHSHVNAHPPSPLPEGVALKNLYQIRISKSKGGIHGVFVEDVFYVIWLDPLHNMYPDDNYGGLRKILPPSNCCEDREEELLKLKQENEQLKEENKYWESELNKL